MGIQAKVEVDGEIPGEEFVGVEVVGTGEGVASYRAVH